MKSIVCILLSRTGATWQQGNSALKGSATGELSVVVNLTGGSEQDGYGVPLSVVAVASSPVVWRGQECPLLSQRDGRE